LIDKLKQILEKEKIMCTQRFMLAPNIPQKDRMGIFSPDFKHIYGRKFSTG